jgi:NADPH-dependent 2,4-dienoyl-CoA reductase/sulfur reductase-like enzyme
MKHYDLLVAGGDAAGMSAASQARRIDPDMTIGVMERGEHVSYAACGMPYYLSGDIDDHRSLFAIDPEKFINERNIDIKKHHEVISANFDNKQITVQTTDGKEDIRYGKLVIATGARALRPPIEGLDSEGVVTLRNMDDLLQIDSILNEKKPASCAIIGAGYIGLEMAESFRKLDMDVTIVEMAPAPGPAFSPSVQELVTKTLKENNVALQMNTTVRSIERKGDSLTVNHDRGSLEVDLVLVSVGIRPATGFLENSGLALMENGAVMVNERSETNIPDVYSAGDCASVHHLVLEKDVYFPLGSTANKQGRVAGLQAAGVSDERFPGIVGSQFVKVFDLEIGKTGLNAGDAKKEGMDASSENMKWRSRAGYYPGGQPLTLTMTVRLSDNRIIGCEIAGTDGAAHRMNTAAAAITSGMTVHELAYCDLGYAPPFSPVWDPVNAVAQKFLKRSKK